MKIAVSQGHAKGIGLEVFLKSCLFLGKKTQELLLFSHRQPIEDTLNSLGFPFSIQGDELRFAGVTLKVHWEKSPQSFSCLTNAMGYAQEKNCILFTLPTSKDEFPGYPGHTEFFRSHFKNPDLGMYFSSPGLQVLLLTDHVAIKDLPEVLTEELVTRRLRLAIKTLRKWDWPIERILVAGLNPHAGEGGLIGKEDDRIRKAIARLRLEEDFTLSGPYPGDTMLFEQRSSWDLLVYPFHDQALGVFKGREGFIGSNITLGLPFPRFSPDHGTSFGLFGKNEADYRGCAFALSEALALLEKLKNGKDSGHQGQGPQPKKRRR